MCYYPHMMAFDIHNYFVATRSDEVSGTPPHPRNPKSVYRIIEKMKSKMNDNKWKFQVMSFCIYSLLPWYALFYLLGFSSLIYGDADEGTFQH